ncbi:MAG: amidohydrolase, partial [Flavobacteriaceae bacterium]|nr:amidohydrolase [Flavobacteriaceae bacterium]
MKKILFITLINLFYYNFSISQIAEAPERFRGEGPFEQLIIRGATLINGNGAPPIG